MRLCAYQMFPRERKTLCFATQELVMTISRETIHLALQWRHNEHAGLSNHQPHDCWLNRSFWRRSEKISNLHVTGFCEGNSPVTGEFPHKWTVTGKMLPFDDVIMDNFVTPVFVNPNSMCWKPSSFFHCHYYCIISLLGIPCDVWHNMTYTDADEPSIR